MRKFIREHISVKLLLPLLFVTYLGSVSLFPHSHIVDGCKIVHSHPFSGGHSHEGKSAETILFLSFFHIDGNILPAQLPLTFILLCGLFIIPSSSDGSSQRFIHFGPEGGLRSCHADNPASAAFCPSTAVDGDFTCIAGTFKAAPRHVHGGPAVPCLQHFQPQHKWTI